MSHSPLELTAIADVRAVAAAYLAQRRHPPMAYQRALAAVEDVTTRPLTLLAAAVEAARAGDGEAAALLVGAGVDPTLLYRCALWVVATGSA